jgi:nucleoside-diphosphate-sugar epimerase
MADVGMSRVLVTGHNGYIGSILTGILTGAGHEVVGLDSFIFEDCTFGDDTPEVAAIRKDVRDVEVDDLVGFDAVCHLAGISNDPVGDLNPSITYDVNHKASVRLAELSKQAGVERFVFSSSCSIYGSSPGGWVDEGSGINPVTPYGWSKINVEEDLRPMASDDFSPVFLRNATAYGLSPRLRADLVVNNLVGYAVTQGRVFMKSDGTPWRPLVHIEDISRAFLAVIEAPREVIHNEVFNVGSTEENYQIREVASIVENTVPGAVFEMAGTAGPDIRDYRVNCDKLASAIPGYVTKWTVKTGAAELFEAFQRFGLTEDQFLEKLLRIKHIKREQSAGRLDDDLRLVGGKQDVEAGI